MTILSPSIETNEIQISEEKLQQIGAIVLILTVLFTIIGGWTSPYDENGKPVLLLPEVKAFEDYRGAAKGWLIELNKLDGEISSLLSEQGQGDLFTQSRQGQQMLQHAVELTQKIDRFRPPAAAAGIHGQIYSASMAYLEIARMAMQWVSVPEKAKKDEIKAKFDQVHNSKAVLEGNQWLNKP
jgi:hypothetical protein